MCMATPVKIKSKIKNQKLKVIVDKNNTIDISLVPDAKIGDWLLVHGELAINKISDEEAKKILSLVKKCSCNHKHSV